LSEGGGRGPEAERARRPPPGGIGAAAALLGGSVLLSRAIGYLRDILLADRVGAGPEADAYFVAFQLPDMLNYLLAGGALAIAFLPFYSRLRDREGEAAAEAFFATVLGTLGAVALVATALLFLYADALIAFQFPDFSPDTRALAARLTRIVLPAQFFFVTGGILRAVLMAEGRFGAQAAAPLVYNTATIVGGLATGTPAGFAWGVLAGAVLGNWLIPLLDLQRRRRVRVRVALRDRRFLAYLWIALPLMLGLSLATVDEWYERYIGAGLAEGVVAYLSYARKLMMAPVAVVGQAVAAAALPTLAALHAAGRKEELEATLLRTLQATVALAVCGAAALFALAEPLVTLMYRHGRFSSDDAAHTTALLSVMAFGVPAWVTQQVAVRAFYAREDTWRPMALGTVVALAAIPLYLAFAQAFGARGLAAAGAIAMTINAGATLAWARARHGGPPLGPFFSTAARALAVALPALGAAWLVQGPGEGFAAAARNLALGGAAFAAVLLPLARLAGGAAMREAVDVLLRRLRPGRARGR